MRFVITNTYIEYWTTKGRVTRYPNNYHTRGIVIKLVAYYNLRETITRDRVELTEYLI
jgi:hypothetical protein